MIGNTIHNKKLLPLALLLGSLTLGGAGWFGYSLWTAASNASSGWRTANEDMRGLLLQQSESRGTAKAQLANTATAVKTKEAAVPTASAARPSEAGAGSQSDSSPGTASTEQAPLAEANKGMASSTVEASSKDAGKTAKPSEKRESGVKISLNTASAQQLTAIPGIGDSKARAIVAYRDQIGRFQQVEQLLDVKGIGDKLLEKMRPYVTVES